MARFLLVVLPLPAHTNAALAVSHALIDSGHDVAWCGPSSDLRPLLGPEVTIFPTGKRYFREYAEQGMSAVKVLWDGYLMPLNRFILSAVDEAVITYQPDVIVVDQYALAGALVAQRHGVRWASLCTGAMELTPPEHDRAELESLVHAQLSRAWAMADMPADDGIDLRFSPYLVIALTSTALTGLAPLPERCVLVGPALGGRPTDPDFDWAWWDPDRAHVLVTVGTSSQHMARDFYTRMVTTLRPMADRLQAIVVASPDVIVDPPAHILVAARVPMLDLMPRLDVVVCHGGLGTVGEALAHGVPLILAPMRHDQPVVAAQVAAAGAGIEVSFATDSEARLGAAVRTVLDDQGYRAQARRVAESFAEAGGASAAAAHLVALASAGSGTR